MAGQFEADQQQSNPQNNAAMLLFELARKHNVDISHGNPQRIIRDIYKKAPTDDNLEIMDHVGEVLGVPTPWSSKSSGQKPLDALMGMQLDGLVPSGANRPGYGPAEQGVGRVLDGVSNAYSTSQTIRGNALQRGAFGYPDPAPNALSRRN